MKNINKNPNTPRKAKLSGSRPWYTIGSYRRFWEIYNSINNILKIKKGYWTSYNDKKVRKFLKIRLYTKIGPYFDVSVTSIIDNPNNNYVIYQLGKIIRNRQADEHNEYLIENYGS